MTRLAISVALASALACSGGHTQKVADRTPDGTYAALLTPLPRPKPDWWQNGQRACPPGTIFVESSRKPGRATTFRTARCVDITDLVDHGPYALWRADGTLQEVGWLLRGAQHGRILYFDSERRLRARGFYRDGRLEGWWERFSEGGELFVREHYELGLLDGARTVVEPDGSRTVEQYARGELDGEVIAYHPNGEVARRGAYRRGAPDGAWSQYAADGRTLGTFALAHGTGRYRVWHRNGRLAVDGAYRDGKRSGTWVYFDDGGRRVGEHRVVDGDGPVREYYPTGRARLQGTLVGGKRDGVWTWWRADGQVSREVMYDRGTVLLTAIGRSIRAQQAKN